MEKIIELLGSENIEEIKSSLTDIIIERFRSDMDAYDRYLIYPPDMRGITEEVIEDTYSKLKKMYKDAVIEINREYIDQMKAYMRGQFPGDKLLRSKIVDLMDKYHRLGNEHSKEWKFAEELKEILRVTQDDNS